ncbi:hemerythrin domain-containing protein [Fusibacter sp. 3D3]|uniref:hemerythrin domain-containing protein n=1 Tax=Fusibacter sp. 3D3 TaxID=1048380 RepID=UPI0008539900|nr:hemerythrin domain-containing protein [Fusibacter sp. 3D3]GAU79182.1 hemerythrin HHE cation binding domain protein [Fusibacter sp. 3D3]
MDVLAHIKKEHKEFKKMISQIESAQGEKKKEIFREFYAELNGHHEAEEHVVFPLVRKSAKGKDDEVVLEMIEEHSLGRHQFSILERTAVDNETWDAKFSVLKEVLNHHMEEEENTFMPLARKVVPKEHLDSILDEFESVLETYKMKKKEKLQI